MNPHTPTPHPHRDNQFQSSIVRRGGARVAARNQGSREQSANDRSDAREAGSEPISIVLPTFNEVETVPGVIEELQDQLVREHETIVVDDDSPDGTPEVVDELWSDDPRVRVVKRTDESGLASAVLRGIREAKHEAVVVLDADGQHPPSIVPSLVAELERGSDVVVGSRHAGGAIESEWSRTRYALSFGASLLAWAAIPDARPLQDPMSGCFAVRRNVVASVDGRLEPQGFKILLEILAVAPIDEVAEVPLYFEPRGSGESNMDTDEVRSYIRHLARLARVSRQKQRPQRARSAAEVSD